MSGVALIFLVTALGVGLVFGSMLEDARQVRLLREARDRYLAEYGE